VKVSCTFDKDTRTITMTAEDNLETLILTEIAERTAKGSKLQVTNIVSPTENKSLVVELKVNGH
jgi:hypothetical protein